LPPRTRAAGTDPRLRSQFATGYIAANQPEKAIELLQSLLASGEAHPALRYNLAYALSGCQLCF